MKKKLANTLVLLAIVATASGIYLGRRGPSTAAPEVKPAASSRSELSSEVVRLRRELAAMKAQIALLQNDPPKAAKPAAEPKASGSDSSHD